jgi:uncharacterized protein
MNCEQTRKLLHGFVDRELGVETSLAIENHLESCPACAELTTAARAARTAAASAMAYRPAPAELRARLQRRLQPARFKALRWTLTMAPVVALALAAGWIAGRHAAAPVAMESRVAAIERVVYHINSADGARAALRNLANHAEASPQTHIVVVAHGTGVDFLLTGAKDRDGVPYQPDVAQLRKRGIDFRVCRTTLDIRHIDVAAVIPQAVLVPSGIAEIARLQAREGYAYLRL